MNNIFLRPLKWALLPTVFLYLCFSFYELSFVEPLIAFKENKFLRLMLMIIEIFVYLVLFIIYKNKQQYQNK